MISKSTIEILETIRIASDEIYTEGGFTYQFRFAKNLAHYLMSLEFKSLDSIWGDEEKRYLSKQEVAEVAYVIDGAIGNRIVRAGNVSIEANELTDRLLSGLQKDTQYEQIYIGKLCKHNHDMGEELILVMTCGNDFFSMDADWTVD